MYYGIFRFPKDVCGFKTGHEYTLRINKGEYGYDITAIKEDGEDVNKYISLSSENSIKKYWDIKDA